MPRTFVWHPTRGPKVTPKDVAPTGGKVQITQVKSGIGHSETMRLTLRALGHRQHRRALDAGRHRLGERGELLGERFAFHGLG